MKKLPNGISNYEELVEDGYVYKKYYYMLKEEAINQLQRYFK